MPVLIIGKPTLQTVIDLIEDEGCPVCGESPGGIQVNGPNEIVLGCGHVLDAQAWIDGHQ